MVQFWPPQTMKHLQVPSGWHLPVSLLFKKSEVGKGGRKVAGDRSARKNTVVRGYEPINSLAASFGAGLVGRCDRARGGRLD